jgi:hypothetical protein
LVKEKNLHSSYAVILLIKISFSGYGKNYNGDETMIKMNELTYLYTYVYRRNEERSCKGRLGLNQAFYTFNQLIGKIV